MGTAAATVSMCPVFSNSCSELLDSTTRAPASAVMHSSTSSDFVDLGPTPDPADVSHLSEWSVDPDLGFVPLPDAWFRVPASLRAGDHPSTSQDSDRTSCQVPAQNHFELVPVSVDLRQG